MQPNQQAQGLKQPDQERIEQFYEQLRQVLVQAVSEGIPGMDAILNMLSQQHTKLVNPNDALGQQPATPSSPTPQGSYSPFK